MPRQGSLFKELTGFACLILLSALELLHWGQSALGCSPTDYSSSQERLWQFSSIVMAKACHLIVQLFTEDVSVLNGLIIYYILNTGTAFNNISE